MDKQSSSQPPSASQPVAYDRESRPLYTAPVNAESAPAAPQFVHVSRAVSPAEPPITKEIKAKHDESVKRYPSLNLSDAEFIINEVRRHPIGLLVPAGLTIFLVALVISVVVNYPLMTAALGLVEPPAYGLVALLGFFLVLLFAIGGYVAVWVYRNNKFFLTNESVIQEIQTSLFSRREQTVSLANIEDASYRQQGIIQTFFNYGLIRLSTEGDETTYRFHYVSNPKQQIATLNNAVEAFKNGRPVSDN